MILLKRRTTLLFLIIWAHVTLLDLFYVGNKGPVFLWAQNIQPKTLLTHFFIALLSLLFYIAIVKVRRDYRSGQLKVSEKILLLCSLCLVASIGFLLS